jgi:Flp pilus assembly protein protease CpaA
MAHKTLAVSDINYRVSNWIVLVFYAITIMIEKEENEN